MMGRSAMKVKNLKAPTGGKMMYMNCNRCMETLPPGKSPREYARCQMAFNEHGDIRVECSRHNLVVFEGPIAEPARSYLMRLFAGGCSCPDCDSHASETN